MDYNLSKREKEVLSLVIEGKTNPEIADILFINIHTVKSHMCSIIEKLKANGRTNAAVLAIKYGIVDIELV